MSSAVLSECGLYRYRLDRNVCEPYEGSKVFAFFGVNPSTADATLDDATVRKWRGFTLRNGGHRFIVGNVFAYRATDVRELKALSLEVARGPELTKHWIQICAEADVLVPCWGRLDKVSRPHHLGVDGLGHFIMGFVSSTGKPVLHFGTTKCGQPRHPLMLGYDTPLTPWSKV